MTFNYNFQATFTDIQVRSVVGYDITLCSELPGDIQGTP
uniref:Uncharacterized protein n=1 Tax=Anguilla anguilla TaxID=7936 RepID=A0A0E9UF03_ANGAN